MVSNNYIDGINKWIKNNLSGIKIGVNDKLTTFDPKNKLPEPIKNWIIYNTSGNQNDCMIHALLIDCSEDFRKLESKDKDTVARKFREGPFLNEVLEYYTNKKPNESLTDTISSFTDEEKKNKKDNLITKDTREEYIDKIIKGPYQLKQEFLKPICIKYKFNVLFYSNVKDTLNFEFEPSGEDFNTKVKTIVIYNPSNVHFSAMSQANRTNFFIDTQTVFDLKTAIENSLSDPKNDVDKKCNFKLNDIIVYPEKYKGYIVEDIKWDSYKDPPECIKLKLIKDGSITDYIDISNFIKPDETQEIANIIKAIDVFINNGSSSSTTNDYGDEVVGVVGAIDGSNSSSSSGSSSSTGSTDTTCCVSGHYGHR
jgi:hypothetical protein